MKVLAISAGTSNTSASTRLATKIAEATGDGIEVVGLKPYARDIADAITRGYPSEKLAELFGAVDRADALVAVTPIYNAMPSGLFISFFDVLPEETLQGKPVALGATGGSPRHSLVIEQAMRPMFVYMHATVPTTAVYAATEDWGAPGEGFEGSAGRTLSTRIRREGQELTNLVAVSTGQQGSPVHYRGVASEDELGYARTESQNSLPAKDEDGPAATAVLGDGQSVGDSEVVKNFESAKSAEDAAIAQFPDFVPFDQLLK